MANFNLPFGVYVAGAFALDASRYFVPDIAARDFIITEGRGYEGLQTFVDSTKKVYIYKNSSWEEFGSGDVSLGYINSYFMRSASTGSGLIWNGTVLDVSAGDSFWALDSSIIQPVSPDYDVQLNSIQIETDAGAVTIMDMPVTSSPLSGSEESYTFKLDGNSFLTIYSEATGSGGIMHEQVKSEVPIVVNSTKYFGIGDPCTNGSWRFVLSSGNLSIQKLVAGAWVEKSLIS